MNKRRHAKTFPLAATVIIVAVAICVVTFAVKALMVKYQVIEGGKKLKLLERELADLTIQNEFLQTASEKLTALPKLHAAINSKYLDLVKIDDSSVVYVGRPVKADVAATLPSTLEDGR